MRSKLFLGLALVLLTVMSWGGEPWKEKPYTAWNDSDVRKILEGSPWSKTISVAATWLRTGAQGPELGTKISIPPPPRDPDHVEDPDLKAPPPVHDRLYNQFARFVLRWESSRTVRTASQLRALHQSSSAATLGQLTDSWSAAEPPEYELLLIGDLLAPFPIATEFELKANTVLQCVGSGRKLFPSRIIVQRRDDGQILEVRFFFQKTTASGQPTLVASEKAIEFQGRVGGANLRARFEPARMVDANGPDLR